MSRQGRDTRAMIGSLGSVSNMQPQISNDGDFTAEQIAQIREAFNYFDDDKTGYLNKAQVGDAMRALGENPTEAELERIVEQMEANRIVRPEDYESKSTLLLDLEPSTTRDIEPSALTSNFDDEKDKDFDAIDFSQFLIMMAHKMATNSEDEQQIRESFKILDQDENGMTDVNRLIRLMTTCGEPLLEQEIKELFKLGDIHVNDKGQMKLEDFISFMLSHLQ